MARIELSNAGGGGGGTLTLTTTGTSGASTLAGSVLNIPIYQGQLTLTTTGTSGAATLVGDTLNIPNYATGGSPAGSAGQVQFNSTPAGSFAASSNLVFDTSGPFLKVGMGAPIATIGVNGVGSLAGTSPLHVRNSSSVDLFKLNDNGQVLIGKNGAGTTQSTASIEISTTDANTNIAIVPKGTGAIVAQIPDGTATGGNARGGGAIDFQRTRSANSQVASGSNSFLGAGTHNTVSGASSAILAGGGLNTGNTVSGGSSVIACGTRNNIAGGSSFIGGGDQSTTGGGSYNFIGAGANNSTSPGSTSYNGVVAGNGNGAVGGSCFVGGGNSNSASAVNSAVLGGSTNSATAEISSAFNGFSRAYLYGQMAIGSGRFGTSGNGDAQTSNIRIRREITGTAIAELTADGAAPSSTSRLILPLPTGATNGRLWNFIIQLSAICNTQGNGTLTAGASFIGTYNGGIKRIANATSLVGTVQNMITAQSDANMSSSVVTITADDTNESLKIEFTPPTTAGSTTVIRVVATVYLTEVGY